MANLSDPSSGNGVPDELRDLASNLLVASPSLFDDPDARDFLLQLDRLMAGLFAAASGRFDRPDGLGQTSALTKQMNQVQSSFRPLVARFPPDYQQRVRDTDTAIDNDSDSSGSGDSGSANSGDSRSSGSGSG
jgi:hypothetical protein